MAEATRPPDLKQRYQYSADFTGISIGVAMFTIVLLALVDVFSLDLLQFAGRIMFVGIFAISGAGHLMRRDLMTEYARTYGAPFPDVMVPLTGIMILAGAALVAVGVWMDLGALLIALFLLPTAYHMHAYWIEEEPQMRAIQQAHFLKNVALAGAALVLVYMAVRFESGIDVVMGPTSLWNQLGW